MQTIKSVNDQSYNNIEHIIIDGGSSDDTLKIISEHSTSAKFISELDNGIYDAINKGIRLASGEIIGILNSDDLFSDSNVVNRIVKEFNDNSLEAVFSDVTFFSDNQDSRIVRYFSSKLFRPWMFRFGFQPAHPTFYCKKELFDIHGYYDVSFKIAGDFELLTRFLEVNKVKYKYVNDIWVKMKLGGISTNGLGSNLLLNREILIALKLNSIKSNMILIYSKYFIKVWGYLRRI
jgi:glycosyltransferase involved in cell wall biosynthesis